MKKIERPDDIADLPWAGNYGDDIPCFKAVEVYIMGEPELAKRQKAEELANWHGCGERVVCPPDFDPRDNIINCNAIGDKLAELIKTPGLRRASTEDFFADLTRILK
jgi:hypothetical protein